VRRAGITPVVVRSAGRGLVGRPYYRDPTSRALCYCEGVAAHSAMRTVAGSFMHRSLLNKFIPTQVPFNGRAQLVGASGLTHGEKWSCAASLVSSATCSPAASGFELPFSQANFLGWISGSRQSSILYGHLSQCHEPRTFFNGRRITNPALVILQCRDVSATCRFDLRHIPKQHLCSWSPS
jgi:hypothetical protein